jgi:hypothetical protein
VSVAQTGGTFDKAGQRATIPTLAAGAEAVFAVRVRATRTAHFRPTATVQGGVAEDRVANNRAAVSLWAVPVPPPPAAPARAILTAAFWR